MDRTGRCRVERISLTPRRDVRCLEGFNEIYRVIRSPEQERARRRGQGTTTERPRATLWRRTDVMNDTDEGSVLAAQWGKVTEEIERMLAFRSDQFRQVVMLPQGQFRQLLLASSQERQQIFEALFQTELYRRVEEALKDAAREIAAEMEDRQRRRHLILEQGTVGSEDEILGRQQGMELRLSGMHTQVEAKRGRHWRRLSSRRNGTSQPLSNSIGQLESSAR